MRSERSGIRLTRRTLLAATAALSWIGTAGAAVPRLAVIDWGLLETLLAIGIVPAAATELRQFRQIAVEPLVPKDVIDLGLRGAPNLELLRQVAPERILASDFYEYQRPQLERVAPVSRYTIYRAGTPPYGLAETSMRGIGQAFGAAPQAERYIAELEADIATWRAALAPAALRPAFAISLGDARHFRAFGSDSMIGDMLSRLGFANAWQDQTSYNATAPIGIEALARVPEARIIVVAPVPPEAGARLGSNALWAALPAVRGGRVTMLASVNHFGGLPSARRFGTLLADALASKVMHG